MMLTDDRKIEMGIAKAGKLPVNQPELHPAIDNIFGNQIIVTKTIIYSRS